MLQLGFGERAFHVSTGEHVFERPARKLGHLHRFADRQDTARIQRHGKFRSQFTVDFLSWQPQGIENFVRDFEQKGHCRFNGAAASTDVSRASIGKVSGKFPLQLRFIEWAADLAFLQQTLEIPADESGEFHRLADRQRAARVEGDRQIDSQLPAQLLRRQVERFDCAVGNFEEERHMRRLGEGRSDGKPFDVEVAANIFHLERILLCSSEQNSGIPMDVPPHLRS